MIGHLAMENLKKNMREGMIEQTRRDMSHYLGQLHDLKEVQAIEEFVKWLMVNDKMKSITLEEVEQAAMERGEQIAREMYESYHRAAPEEPFKNIFDLPNPEGEI